MSRLFARLARFSALENAALILFAASAALVGAWIFEAFGYLPCELCLKQRIPYYFGIPLALLVTYIAARGPKSLLAAGFAALALVFAASCALGVYHAGVEWGFWQGPTACTGSAFPAGGGDLLQQLKTVKVVRCDAVAIRILGLSLAGWNALVSLAIAALAARGALGRGVQG